MLLTAAPLAQPGQDVAGRMVVYPAAVAITARAVEYHLGNIYAKCGVQGRQGLRRFVGQWRQPVAV